MFFVVSGWMLSGTWVAPTVDDKMDQNLLQREKKAEVKGRWGIGSNSTICSHDRDPLTR